MIELNLTERDVSYYDDIFQKCDPDDSENIQFSRLVKLLKSAHMPSSIIKNILDLCKSIDNVNEQELISRHQFHAALKLTAAYQIGMPLRKDILTIEHAFPLPKFVWATLSGSSSAAANQKTQSHLLEIKYKPHIDTFSTDSDENSAYQLRSTSANSIRNENNDDADADVDADDDDDDTKNDNFWPISSTYEEQLQLLATEESDDKHSSDDFFNYSDDGEINVTTKIDEFWEIVDSKKIEMSSEQKRSYAKEFEKLDRDRDGLLSYSTVSRFFETLCSSNEDIEKVWKLTTGSIEHRQITLEQFRTALHLIILKRTKQIEMIPSQLNNFKQLPPSRNVDWPSVPKWIAFGDADVDARPEPVSVPDANVDEERDPDSKSLVDFGSERSKCDLLDIQVLHPEPKKIAVANQQTKNSQITDGPTSLPNVQAPISFSSSSSSSFSSSSSSTSTSSSSSVFSSLTQYQAAKNESTLSIFARKDFSLLPPPPPPPPRPVRQHARSSSLDLSRKPFQVHQTPTIPPRNTISPSKKWVAYKAESFADFENQKKSMDLSLEANLKAAPKKLSGQLKHGAFEFYHKKGADSLSQSSAGGADGGGSSGSCNSARVPAAGGGESLTSSSATNAVGTATTNTSSSTAATPCVDTDGVTTANWKCSYLKLQRDRDSLKQSCYHLMLELQALRVHNAELRKHMKRLVSAAAKPN